MLTTAISSMVIPATYLAGPLLLVKPTHFEEDLTSLLT